MSFCLKKMQNTLVYELFLFFAIFLKTILQINNHGKLRETDVSWH